ncbi:Dabb family protein [Acidipila sp. EB88]|uniref:Dabb family protein n=1 Tax=Acidipila sp. EB88 TaxID=2305226 RepID=UPI000F5FD528|nr:Dabb family protein [Acidipila sp. EB88]RRA48150.1 Dabb family protein [Acidipila sp. EB88]
MIVHNFAFRWQPGVTGEQKQRAAEAIRALQSAIPEVLALYVGTNVSPRGQGYEFGGSMHFADLAALERYNQHPAHQALLGWLMPLVEPLEIDFEA